MRGEVGGGGGEAGRMWGLKGGVWGGGAENPLPNQGLLGGGGRLRAATDPI